MPIGKFRGVALSNVPAYYLIYIFDEKYEMPENLRTYIKENYIALKTEAKRVYTNPKITNERKWKH